MVAANALEKKKTKKRAIPESLVYEYLDGKLIYRKGYKEVLNKKKKLEEIIGTSGLQSVILSYLMEMLFLKIDKKQYWVLSNEIGTHIAHRENPASDIGIFEKSVLTPNKVTTKYVDVPAKVFIEVDIRAALEDLSETGYISLKTNKLLDFGAEKIIWILSETQQVIVAEKGAKNWLWMNWSESIELVEGIEVNIGAYLQAEGIDPKAITE
ncbi:MAG: Uma2 family endonuclease [Saprospiraceae bacterium]|nr:Uma2 family endonuclease [Saprospiraceae bacterium]